MVCDQTIQPASLGSRGRSSRPSCGHGNWSITAVELWLQDCSYQNQELYFQFKQVVCEAIHSYEAEQRHQHWVIHAHVDEDLAGDC